MDGKGNSAANDLHTTENEKLLYAPGELSERYQQFELSLMHDSRES